MSLRRILSSQIPLFWNWERVSWQEVVKVSPNCSSMRSFCQVSNNSLARKALISKVAMTLVSVLLTCCPPGPVEQAVLKER